MSVGSRISEEADADWRREREVAAAAGIPRGKNPERGPLIDTARSCLEGLPDKTKGDPNGTL
jgi:hypothetical protein